MPHPFRFDDRDKNRTGRDCEKEGTKVGSYHWKSSGRTFYQNCLEIKVMTSDGNWINFKLNLHQMVLRAKATHPLWTRSGGCHERVYERCVRAHNTNATFLIWILNWIYRFLRRKTPIQQNPNRKEKKRNGKDSVAGQDPSLGGHIDKRGEGVPKY